MEVGLVLEGGGMRGAYTSGVLDMFMEEAIDFNYIIGVSAGASNGASYVSNQLGRNKKVFVDRVGDREAAGLRHFLFGDGYLNMDYLYDVIPNEKEPFDYESFRKSGKIFKVALTELESGSVEYIDVLEDKTISNEKINDYLRASSSLPIITSPSRVGDKLYFDGGIVDSIPIRKAIEDGYKYNVVVLTRNTDYRKSPQRLGFFSRKYLKRYPRVLEKLEKRHIMYNETVEYIFKLEEEGKIFVFRPLEKINVGRLDKDKDKLYKLYLQGYKEAYDKLDQFKDWLKKLD